jgi:hypothetical protein
MNLFTSANDREHEEDYWLMLDPQAADAGELAMRALRSKLDNALQDLGRLDYALKSSLERMRCDLITETHDHLHGHVAGLVEPEIKAAVANLAEVIGKARYLIDELAADTSSAPVKVS